MKCGWNVDGTWMEYECDMNRTWIEEKIHKVRYKLHTGDMCRITLALFA